MANVVIKDRRGCDPLKAGALRNAIVSSAGIPSIATDEKGAIQIFSAGAERMLGYTEAEVANKLTPADFCDPVEAIARASALSLEFATPITPGFEAWAFKASRGIADQCALTWIRKDGSRLAAVISVTALRDNKSEIIGYLLIASDDTAQEDFRRTVESVTDCGIVQLDAQGHVLSWNAGAQIIHGYSAHEIVGQHFSRFYSAQEIGLGVPQRELDAAAAAGRYETQGSRTRKDGSTYRANVVLTAVHDQAGVLRGFARLSRELSRAKRQPKERTAESAREQASQPWRAGGVPRRRLLYIEGEAASCGVVAQLVARRTDVLLLRAPDLDVGIELARSARPEVILMNIDLPGISAQQFMTRLRSDRATEGTPLLALGANAESDAIPKGLEAGFFDYLTKPLKPERFMRALEDALEFTALEQNERAFTSAPHLKA